MIICTFGRICSTYLVLPEVVHSLTVAIPFTSILLIMIAHPILHCWPLKENLVDDFGMSNDLLISPTGW